MALCFNVFRCLIQVSVAGSDFCYVEFGTMRVTKIDGESIRYPLDRSAYYNLPMTEVLMPLRCVGNPKEVHLEK